MRDIETYFAFVESLVRHSGATDESITYRLLSPTRGLARGWASFADDSRLEFFESVVLTRGQVRRIRYRYHYMLGGKTLFRYDTAPHYPHLRTFPYHKHDKNGRVVESLPVSLKEVLEEIEETLGYSTGN